MKLRRRLRTAATANARAALVGYRKDDATGFYLNAGTALELAIKARLIEHGAFTIGPANRDWFKHVLALVRDPDATVPSASQSVSGEAIGRLVDLEPSIHAELHGHVLETIDRCSRVKHVGMGEPPTTTEVLSHAASFVRATDASVRGRSRRATLTSSTASFVASSSDKPLPRCLSRHSECSTHLIPRRAGVPCGSIASRRRRPARSRITTTRATHQVDQPEAGEHRVRTRTVRLGGQRRTDHLDPITTA